MNSEYLRIEDANKLANYDKLLAERDTLRADNRILRTKSKENDKKYLKIISEKNNYIKELEEKVSAYESKQIDIFEGNV
ncbi:MAG: hypothetical protein NC483_00650 [Ruminococcus sp.]|nr:hypothetical protein [Ruminococcus sp.]